MPTRLTTAQKLRRNELTEEIHQAARERGGGPGYEFPDAIRLAMARLASEQALERSATMTDEQFKRVMEALGAAQVLGNQPQPPAAAAAPAVEPLTLTSDALAKLSADELAALGAEVWSVYGDQQAMRSPFWRAPA